MKTIYKYPIEVTDDQTIWMPRGAQVLSVQCQSGRPCAWALVDIEQPKEARRFTLVGTGHPCEVLDDAKYVGTFQMHDGALVFHLFDLGETR